VSNDPASDQCVAPTAAVVLRIAGRAGPTFALDPARDNTLGRSQEACIVLADRLASRTHAALRCEQGRWLIHDLASRNGTFVDGAAITAQPIADGAVIRIGTSDLVFRLLAAGVQESPADPDRQFVKCGPVAQLEGSVLRRSSLGSTDDAKRPLLLYQASIRLLASRSVREVIGATIELAIEHSRAAAVGWFRVLGPEDFAPVCVVPPGSGLAALLGEAACRLVAREGNAVWVAPVSKPHGNTGAAHDREPLEVCCVPIVEGDHVHAALAAAAPPGTLRSTDFDFLVALASLAAAACAGHAEGSGPAVKPTGRPADLASLQTVNLEPPDSDDAATMTLESAGLDRLAIAAGEDSPAAARIGAFVAESATLKFDDWQRVLVIEALRRTGGSVPNAAAELGISRDSLRRQLEAFGLATQ